MKKALVGLLDKLHNNISTNTNEAMNNFMAYADMLLEWNVKHNLSGAKSVEEVYLHIVDCIYPLSFLHNFNSCIDIGSGAGFPAIPLAILKKEAMFFLIEPRLKRAAFLYALSANLNLNNIKIYKNRVEELNLRADLITSRSVMSSEKIITICRQNITNNGYYLFFKHCNDSSLQEKIKSLQLSQSLESKSKFKVKFKLDSSLLAYIDKNDGMFIRRGERVYAYIKQNIYKQNKQIKEIK